jgi:hypothetical protein
LKATAEGWWATLNARHLLQQHAQRLEDEGVVAAADESGDPLDEGMVDETV